MKKTLTKVLSLVLVLAMFVSAIPMAMAEGEDPAPTITSISVSPNTLTLKVGETKNITSTVTIEPADATADLDWASTSSAIASVADGVVTANKAGSCQIWARSATNNDMKAIVSVTVTEADEEEQPAAITPSISPSSMTINFGQTKSLPTVTVGELVEGTDYTVAWQRNTSSLEIDAEAGTVTAVGTSNGTLRATITLASGVEATLTKTTLDCSVDISSDLYLMVDDAIIEVSEDSRNITLEEPTLGGAEADAYKIVSYYYTRVSDSIVNVEVDDDTIDPVEAGLDTLRLQAVVVAKDNTGTDVDVPDLLIPVSVYKEADDITAYIKDSYSSFTFDSNTALEELLLGYVDYVDDRYTNTVADLITSENSEVPTDRGSFDKYTIRFDDVDGAGGKLSHSVSSNFSYSGSTTLASLDKVKFTKGSTAAKSTFDYEITDDKGYLMTVGTLYIEYEGTDGIVYETDFEVPVTFDEEDFYDFYEENGSTGTLSYVKFTNLPSSSYGVLYIDSSEDDKVSISDKFEYDYRSGSYYDLDDVTFVPVKRTSEFTVTIPFTAYSTTSKSVTGYVTIEVGEDGATGDIEYETDFDTAIIFDEDDFVEFWDDNASGTLSYVKFTSLPSTYYGALYLDDDQDEKVATSDKFKAEYKSSNTGYEDLDTVTFVPSSSRTTKYTVEIPFTAYGGSGSSKSVTGTVVITVSDDEAAGGDTITALGIYLGHNQYQFDEQIAELFEEEENEDLDYVTFVQPGAKYGKLYYNYESLMDNTEVTSKIKFYYDASSSQNELGDVWFIPAAGYTGTVKLNFTAYGVKNGEMDGVLTIKVSAKSKSSYFNDVNTSSYSWASDAVDFLRYNNIVNGTNDANTQFSPKNSITRAHFMLMLYRAFLANDYSSHKVTSNFQDITKGSSDYAQELYQAVGVAKYLGIATGDGTNFYPNKNISREEAMTLIYRTLDKLNLTLDYTGTKSTSSFSDYSKVSTYAKEPLSYLIEHGVVVGDSGKINPKSNITRAEMAVILHRVLTY